MIETIFKQYKIKLPDFFILDKNLINSSLDDLKSIIDKRAINIEKEGINTENYLQKTVNLGKSKISIITNEPVDLKQQLEFELKLKEEHKKFELFVEEADVLLNNSNSYQEYLISLKPIFLKMYEFKKIF